MTKRSSRPVILIALALLASLLAGCGSSPATRFYLLNGLGGPGKAAPAAAGERCLALGIGPVKLAEYLDRPQIVLRVTPNEVKLAELDHWAEPLERTLSRVLAENLSGLLCTKTVRIYPWTGSPSLDYRVDVEILRLDGPIGQEVNLEVQWTLYDGGGEKKVLLDRKSTFREPSAGEGIPALVSAQSRAVAALSREIAEAIRKQP
jgi:uncharacterized protein